ncbi:hypothetical protein BT96DRAFT_433708 [Gymnopus androsaceus JB14]|uniref:Uncharacterized protein n=1 Tax=Gymnopus androsaceus JB14 TaxID=1447944 RepID=A0A6A4I0H7_9AGAR|nr:hypothetical protein BT96DRAFT_433708 [Gymnopus androsaceus JB14]
MFQFIARRLCGAQTMKTSFWTFNPPQGIAMRSNVGTSAILKTHGSLFHQCFSSATFLSMAEEVCFAVIDSDAQTSPEEPDVDCSSDGTLYSPHEPEPVPKVNGQTQTEDIRVIQVDKSVQTVYQSLGSESEATRHSNVRNRHRDSKIQAEPSFSCSCSCSPVSGTATEPASPDSVYSQNSDDDPEYLEYTMEASNVPDPVTRTPMQDFALTDLLALSILPTFLIVKFEDDEEELEFRQRIGEMLKEYKPLTSAVFLALEYIERLRNRINTINSFYWWFMLCLLYAHQTLDDFGTITVDHVEHFMNIDASFVKRRQRNGYKALEYHLRISQVDWVYFLNHIRVSVGGLPLASAEAILQLISESLPIPSASPKDELLNPLHCLEKALEEDRMAIEQYQCVWGNRMSGSESQL